MGGFETRIYAPGQGLLRLLWWSDEDELPLQTQVLVHCLSDPSTDRRSRNVYDLGCVADTIKESEDKISALLIDNVILNSTFGNCVQCLRKQESVGPRWSSTMDSGVGSHVRCDFFESNHTNPDSLWRDLIDMAAGTTIKTPFSVTTVDFQDTCGTISVVLGRIDIILTTRAFVENDAADNNSGNSNPEVILHMALALGRYRLPSNLCSARGLRPAAVDSTSTTPGFCCLTYSCRPLRHPCRRSGDLRTVHQGNCNRELKLVSSGLANFPPPCFRTFGRRQSTAVRTLRFSDRYRGPSQPSLVV
ncbi:hypothetical protein BDN72DRAFT_468767 [Pluteus cervinus]|uniref:Uncharacterized protein n=1 Tax=Pluteus cervinus TaxID=181527 RepID=A0ACD3AZL1_9AGAR|nr:hypothetical protein BDN72DRAFT_468767 [Pluteus cervinus]